MLNAVCSGGDDFVDDMNHSVGGMVVSFQQPGTVHSHNLQRERATGHHVKKVKQPLLFLKCSKCYNIELAEQKCGFPKKPTQRMRMLFQACLKHFMFKEISK